MANDTVADTLSRLRNAIARGYDEVVLDETKMNKEIARILKQEDFIEDYEVADGQVSVTLKYNKQGDPVVEHFDRVSSPGQRRYVSSKEILPVMNGRGISIISTSSGLMTGAQAKSRSLGGEYICQIW